jgi:peptidoglycan/xylan/chitin deacetylase (PgdA/CDA1 family)
VTYTVTDNNNHTTTVTRNVRVIAEPRIEGFQDQGKIIYLTFDDGPGPHTPKLLDILDAYGIQATFFVVENEHSDMLKDIVDRGHSIGIHCVTHDYETVYASPEAYFEDLFRMQDIIYEKTGVKTTLMRFPGGSSNTISRKTCPGLMTILSEAVQDAGFQYFDWNVDSEDAGGAKKSRQVSRNVINGVSKNEVSIVLQHDIHDFSVEAVEEIIRWGMNNGYLFLPLESHSPGFRHTVVN